MELRVKEQAAQIAALKTVMVAAAEEIAAHWNAHCDAEGYGPQNLLRRLEEGIPSEYGYTAGAFAALTAELELRRKSGSASDRLHNICEGIARDADGSEWSREEWERLDAEMAELKAANKTLTAERDALYKALKDATIRMDRARDILTDGKPTPQCNWGVLDTYPQHKALAARIQAHKPAIEGQTPDMPSAD
jgi:hypothetical protein